MHLVVLLLFLILSGQARWIAQDGDLDSKKKHERSGRSSELLGPSTDTTEVKDVKREVPEFRDGSETDLHAEKAIHKTDAAKMSEEKTSTLSKIVNGAKSLIDVAASGVRKITNGIRSLFRGNVTKEDEKETTTIRIVIDGSLRQISNDKSSEKSGSFADARNGDPLRVSMKRSLPLRRRKGLMEEETKEVHEESSSAQVKPPTEKSQEEGSEEKLERRKRSGEKFPAPSDTSKLSSKEGVQGKYVVGTPIHRVPKRKIAYSGSRSYLRRKNNNVYRRRRFVDDDERPILN